MEINITLEVKYKTNEEWYCFTHATLHAVKGVLIQTVVGEFPSAVDSEDGDSYLRGDEDREDTRCIDCCHQEALDRDALETYAKKLK